MRHSTYVTTTGPLVLLGADLTFAPVAQRVPISLLELNTFGHAVCLLFIYLLWWEKPFEVDIPTEVHSQVLLDMFALAWINRKGRGEVRLLFFS